MFKETDGINQRMRKLLGATFKQAFLPHAREGHPRASLVYSSGVKPNIFVPGIGMKIPRRVETWSVEEPEGMA
jgi:hypothetical protein